MDKDKLLNILYECIKANQTLNGVPDFDLTPETRPIGDLACFDSMTAMEVIVDVELALETELEHEIDLDVGLFFSPKKKEGLKKERPHRSLSIDEIASNIHEHISK